ncbi:ATPdependent RNA helicase [Saitoella coloradoensis]
MPGRNRQRKTGEKKNGHLTPKQQREKQRAANDRDRAPPAHTTRAPPKKNKPAEKSNRQVKIQKEANVPMLFMSKERMKELRVVLAEYHQAQEILRAEEAEEDDDEDDEEEDDDEDYDNDEDASGTFEQEYDKDDTEPIARTTSILSLPPRQFLTRLGFSLSQSVSATQSHPDAFIALRALYNNNPSSPPYEPFPADSETLAEARLMRRTEAERIQDTLGQDFSVEDMGEEEVWTMELGDEMVVEVYHPSYTVYPLEPPLIAILSPNLVLEERIDLATGMMQQAGEIVGGMGVLDSLSWLAARKSQMASAPASTPSSSGKPQTLRIVGGGAAFDSARQETFQALHPPPSSSTPGYKDINLTVPTTRSVRPGVMVDIVLKIDQPTGRLTRGVVGEVLTRGEHHRGIKVRLRDGRVGRVQAIVTEPAPKKIVPKDNGKAVSAVSAQPVAGKVSTPSTRSATPQVSTNVNVKKAPSQLDSFEAGLAKLNLGTAPTKPRQTPSISFGGSATPVSHMPKPKPARAVDPSINNLLYDQFNLQQQNPAYRKMQTSRQLLPAHVCKGDILRAIEQHQVVVIEGDTGCGKSTQVPQFILDDYLTRRKGGECKILVTQPRRISAMGVAERVAAERGERVGGMVGWQIRMESRMSEQTRILFATTGIMLKRLEGSRDEGEEEEGIDGFTHIVIDEVHERSLDSDFLLMVMRDLLKIRPGLKLILMSATLNAGLFQEYFGGETPRMFIPGRTFPVKTMFLEDAVARMRYIPKGTEYVKARRGPAPQMRGKNGAFLTEEEKPDEMLDAQGMAKRYPGLGMEAWKSLQMIDQEKIQYPLIEELVVWMTNQLLAGSNERVVPGAGPRRGGYHQQQQQQQEVKTNRGILVFLPGMMEISTLHTALLRNQRIRDATDNGRFCLPLHGSLSSEDQLRVFDRPSANKVKIVIATNVAETSITVDDVVFVIDSGRMKETRFDPEKGMASLEECWVSQANARQRRGRAGRVAEGTCIHLFTSHKYEKELLPQQIPEMQRTPLEQLCLRIKILPFLKGRIDDVLSKVIEPPSDEAVKNAILTLRTLQALSREEDLTPLGFHLGRLPVDVRIGKLIVMACIFGCLDPCLTIAAAMSIKSPFVAPIDKRAEADMKKRAFATGMSDHLTVLSAYNRWLEVRAEGFQAERAFLFDNFLSGRTLSQISDIKRQLAELLCDIGFLKGNVRARQMERVGRNGRNGDGVANAIRITGGGAHDENSHLIKACLTSALYPNVLKIGPIGRDGPSFTSKGGDDIALHPSSINAKESRFGAPFLIYLEKIRTTRVFARDSTAIPPYAMAFFGGHLKFDERQIMLNMEDGWIRFKCKHSLAALVEGAKSALQELLGRIVEQPELNAVGSPLVEMIVGIVTEEGKKYT